MMLRRFSNRRPVVGVVAAAAAAALLSGCDFAHTLPDAPRSLTGPLLRPSPTSQPLTAPQSVAQAPRSSGVVIVDRSSPVSVAQPPSQGAPTQPSPFAYETFQGYQSPAGQAADQASAEAAARIAEAQTAAREAAELRADAQRAAQEANAAAAAAAAAVAPPSPTVVAAGPVSGADINGGGVEYVDLAALNGAPPSPYAQNDGAYNQTYESSVGAAPVYESVTQAPEIPETPAYEPVYNAAPLYNPQAYEPGAGVSASNGAYEIAVQDSPAPIASEAGVYAAPDYAAPTTGSIYAEIDAAPDYAAPTTGSIYAEVDATPDYASPTTGSIYAESGAAPTYVEPTYEAAGAAPAYAEPTYDAPAPSLTGALDVAPPSYNYVDAGPIEPSSSLTSLTGGSTVGTGGLDIIASADLPLTTSSGVPTPRLRADAMRRRASAAAPALQTVNAASYSASLADGGGLTLVPLNGAPRRQSDAVHQQIVSVLGSSAGGAARKLEGLAILSNRKITIYWRVIDSEGAALKTHVSSVAVSSADWSAVASTDLNALAADAAQWLQGAFTGSGSISIAAAQPIAAPAPMIPQTQPISTGPRPPRRRPSRQRAAPVRPISVAAAPAPRVNSGGSISPALQARPSAPAPRINAGGSSQSAAASVSQAPRPSVQAPQQAAQPANAGARPIFFRGVFGAPGAGDRELAIEVRKILNSNGVRTTTMQTNDALYLSAQVTKTPGDSTDSIKIVWSVKDSLGREYGQVMQENNVPRGSLDGGWGRDAYYAAMGAREGILQLVSLGNEG